MNLIKALPAFIKSLSDWTERAILLLVKMWKQMMKMEIKIILHTQKITVKKGSIPSEFVENVPKPIKIIPNNGEKKQIKIFLILKRWI